MKKNILYGILYSAGASFWWGVVGVFYFKSVSFVDPIELVIHRTIWTAFLLLFTTTFYSKWQAFFLILKNLKKTLHLLTSGVLIFVNWFTWIYAVVTNKLIDASFGYYIMPILSVFLGIIFLKEPYNKHKIFSFLLVTISVVYLLINFNSVPWTGLIVAFTWSTYSFLRKKINVDPDLGLLIESLFMSPIALLVFYFISQDGNIFFSLHDPVISFWLFFAGAITVIPLFLFLKGINLAGLGTSGMIFFITPTCQFLLGIFYYDEYFDLNKLIGFIIIWFAVAIYLKDLANDN
jgi:chloramphenicol-sensitive protein RarD|tara:strand:- start:4337 stop:5212 length:876 start_codon:yes stop_codon:yes gene_type:complete